MDPNHDKQMFGNENVADSCENNVDKAVIDGDIDADDEFYFESDHLALRGNKDYLNLLKTIAILEAQRVKAIKDIDDLLAVKKAALQDPMMFIEKLQKGEDIGVPAPQVIAELPDIDWSQYEVAFLNEACRSQTRKNMGKPQPGGGDTADLETCDQKSRSRVLVRGREFDDSKPETFNQLWTTEEQRRLEELLIEYPPEEKETRRWKKIAAALGNRTPTQVCSRVQKYFIKLQKAGLPVPGRQPKASGVFEGRKSSHRHQRHNHFLMRPTTFFPSHNVPVYMTDSDDVQMAGQGFPAQEEDALATDEYLTDEDMAVDKIAQSSAEMQLELLRRIKTVKEENKVFVKHIGFKCDYCAEEPIVGVRWHCATCRPPGSVDFCTDCAVSQLYSPAPHPPAHRLVAVPGPGRGVWDQDYSPLSFGQVSSYNYLDPNFMPE
ncbi:ZZ-type zinc finger-containing protein 3 [Bacillus rossius redtenbacheri]|uniref:ZZ-type zinc finger-containing protein 3 n=1 Tax=Bacillus rossius redtenbacheri TaxID=93214 RepID=UPI002FDE15F8